MALVREALEAMLERYIHTILAVQLSIYDRQNKYSSGIDRSTMHISAVYSVVRKSVTEPLTEDDTTVRTTPVYFFVFIYKQPINRYLWSTTGSALFHTEA